MRQSRNRPFPISLFILIVALFLSGCVNLAGDITPPPIPPTTQAPLITSLPTQTITPLQDQKEEATPDDPQEGKVLVEVIDHSGGVVLGNDLSVQLEAYDHFERVYAGSENIPETGLVEFGDVPFQGGRVLFASIRYGGAVYRSEIIEITPGDNEITLQVQVFETTIDDSNIVANRVHILFDFITPEIINISEIYILSNYGETTLVGEEFGKPIVSFPLPDGAASIEFDDGFLGERYIKTDDGFGDTLSIPPGEGVYQVVVYYTLPYSRYKLDFEQTMNYPTEALVVMTPPENVKIKGSALDDLGTQSIPNGAVQVYIGEAVSRGEKIQFRVSGAPETIRGISAPPSIQFSKYLIGIASFGILLFSAGVYLFFKNRRKGSLEGMGEDPSEIKTRILDSIIALEDLYNSGEIPEDVFQKKRQEYIDHLKKIDK